MFDYVDHKPVIEPGRPRYLTGGFSAVLHVVVVGLAVGLPILYASNELPEPPSMMAFVMDAVPPPPPPPPPAPAPAAAKPAEAPKPNATAIEQPKPIPQANPVAAPVEAPAAVTPETGLEANAGAAKPAIEAGFENGVSGGIPGGVPGGVTGGIDAGAPPPPPPPPAPKVPQGPVRVGGQVKAPQLTHRVNPTYPPMAQAANLAGNVVLEAQVNKAGRVESVRVVKGHGMLDQAAVAAVKQWQYEPLTLNGQAVEFILTVTVTFSIPR
jgi:protein TonB